MNANRNFFFGCASCSTFFANRSQHLANCVDERNPSCVTGRLLNTARNVYQQEAAEDDTIVGRFSIEDAEGRIGVKLTAVYCVGCRIECGWKITEVNPHPLFRQGQYLLDASVFYETVRTL